MSRLPDFSTARRSEPTPSRDRFWFSLGALVFFLSSAVTWNARAARMRAEASYQRVREETARLERRIQRAAKNAGARDVLETRSRRAVAQPPGRVLAELEGLMPPAVRLRRAAMSYVDHVALELHVQARTSADYDRFLDRLAGSPRIAHVAGGPENRDGEVQSVVNVVLAERVEPR